MSWKVIGMAMVTGFLMCCGSAVKTTTVTPPSGAEVSDAESNTKVSVLPCLKDGDGNICFSVDIRKVTTIDDEDAEIIILTFKEDVNHLQIHAVMEHLNLRTPTNAEAYALLHDHEDMKGLTIMEYGGLALDTTMTKMLTDKPIIYSVLYDKQQYEWRLLSVPYDKDIFRFVAVQESPAPEETKEELSEDDVAFLKDIEETCLQEMKEAKAQDENIPSVSCTNIAKSALKFRSKVGEMMDGTTLFVKLCEKSSEKYAELCEKLKEKNILPK